MCVDELLYEHLKLKKKKKKNTKRHFCVWQWIQNLKKKKDEKEDIFVKYHLIENIKYSFCNKRYPWKWEILQQYEPKTFSDLLVSMITSLISCCIQFLMLLKDKIF
jgi:hypothetical protein